jgi:uncharacterized protein YqgC (DUF456 family)
MIGLGIYYAWALLLLLANVGAWCLNLFMLPGNWTIVAATALFAWLVPTSADTPQVSWAMVGVLVGLAVLGEVCEFAASAAGAAKQGASRRAIVLSIVGAMAGSMIGMWAGVLIPIPIVGSLIGAVGGGALGAFAGAYLGEHWKGSPADQRHSVAEGAFVGRFFGTFAKLAVGAIMVVVATVDSLL